MIFERNSQENVIKVLILMANADNNLHENEIKIIKDKITQHNLNPKLFNDVLAEIKQLNTQTFKMSCLETLKLITDKELRNTTLKLLSSLAAEDFIIHEDEMMLLQLIADEWKMYKTSLNQ